METYKPRGFELHPIAEQTDGTFEIAVDPEDTKMWSIYMVVHDERNDEEFAVCIGDFDCRESAEGVMSLLHAR